MHVYLQPKERPFAEQKEDFKIHVNTCFSPNDFIMLLLTPSAGLHLLLITLQTWEEAEYDCWKQVSGIQLPSPAPCLPLNPSASVGLSAFSLC